MAGLRGKFLRREGTMTFFGSKNKPEWKPIEISGQLDYNQLESGRYYELELQGNTLTAFKLLPPMGAQGGFSPPPGASQVAQHPTAARTGNGRGIDANSLFINATGFAKSAMEGRLVDTPGEAMAAALDWARLWGPVPTLPKKGQLPPDPAFSPPEPPGPELEPVWDNDESF